VCGRLEGVYEDLETGRVAGEFEESHDTDDAEELEDVVLLLKLCEQKVEIERERGDKVDDVDRSADERHLAWTDDEPGKQSLTSLDASCRAYDI